jgi:hypothetical protein
MIRPIERRWLHVFHFAHFVVCCVSHLNAEGNVFEKCQLPFQRSSGLSDVRMSTSVARVLLGFLYALA